MFISIVCTPHLFVNVGGSRKAAKQYVSGGRHGASEVACGLVESGEVGGRLVFLKTEMFSKIFLFIQNILLDIPKYPKNILQGLGVGMADSSEVGGRVPEH